jgi:hypothetical protein
MAEGAGRIDLRMLVLLGNLGLAAILVVLWLQFRDRVGAPLVAAAGFLLCHVTYYEGALMAMSALSNIGVLAFALACFHFAMKRGGANAAAGLAFGLLAAGSLANGLFALPVAAAACALRRQWPRAAAYGLVGLALWPLYMAGYEHPSYHASPLEALNRPLDTAWLFVVTVGGMAKGVWRATAFGAVLLAALAWLALGGFWRRRPAIAAFVAFILLSIAAAAVGRIGFGVFWASRYAVNSSALAAVVFLLVTERRSWTPAAARLAVAAAAMASLLVSWIAWPAASELAFRGRLLAKPLPDSPAMAVEPYVGLNFPNYDIGTGFLARAEARKLYAARGVPVFAAELRASQAAPAPGRQGGALGTIEVAGARVVVTGWTDLTALLRGRVFTAHSPGRARASALAVLGRTDIAVATRRPDLLFSGFRWEGEYESADEARRAAGNLCLLVEAPGHAATALLGNDACGPVQGERR